MISSAEMAAAMRDRDDQADADAGDRAAEELREYEHERQDRQNRDVAARHVRRQPHRQREGPDEHPHDLDRNQEDVDRPGQAVRDEVLPVLDETVRLRAGGDDRDERDRRERGGHVEVGGRGRAAVQHLLHERVLGAVDHVVIDQAENLEDREEADRVRAQDEHEERQDERRPGVDPLAPDVRLDDRIADELDDRLEPVHQARRDVTVLAQVPANRHGDDDKYDRRDDPQHEDVLRDREIDPEDLREMDERMVDPAVCHVPDDGLRQR